MRLTALCFLLSFVFSGALTAATIEFVSGQKVRVELVEDRTDSLIVKQNGKTYRIPLEDIKDFSLNEELTESPPVPDRYLFRRPTEYQEARVGLGIFGGGNAGPARESYPYAFGASLFLEPQFSRFSFWGFGFSGLVYSLPGERSRINAGSLFTYVYFDMKASPLAYFYAELGAGGTYLQWLPSDGRRWVPAATMALGWQGLSTETIRLRINLRSYYAHKTEFTRPVVPVGLEMALLILY